MLVRADIWHGASYFEDFYQVFVNICAFLLEIHGKATKQSGNCTKK